MKNYQWYQKLKKPTWAPPSKVFGQVWAVLYILIAISYLFVFYAFFAGSISFMVLIPFILNLIFNFSYTPLQFKLKSNLLAAVDVLLVVGTLVWGLIVIFPYAPLVTILNIPYLLWGCFAAALQINILYLNRKK